MAAVLDAAPGAFVSHSTAAALWRLPGFPADIVHESAARSQRAQDVSGRAF